MVLDLNVVRVPDFLRVSVLLNALEEALFQGAWDNELCRKLVSTLSLLRLVLSSSQIGEISLCRDI
jgi:hypothetical protein